MRCSALVALSAGVALFPSFKQGSDVPAPFKLDKSKCLTAYRAGRDEAGKGLTLKGFLKQHAISLGSVRAPSSWGWEAPWALLCDPCTSLECQGLDDARKYKPSLDAATLPTNCDNVQVIVVLWAWPGTRGILNNRISRPANKDDVENVNFALLPDGDKDRAILPGEIEHVSSNDLAGTETLPRYNTTTVDTNVSGSGRFYMTHSTVSFWTQETQGYDAFRAAYTLNFPLFDSKGTSLIPANTKTLALKVVYPSGEHTAVFKIAP